MVAHLRVALDHADEVAAAAEDGWDGGSVGSHFVWVVPVMEGGKSSACVSTPLSQLKTRREWCHGGENDMQMGSGCDEDGDVLRW